MGLRTMTQEPEPPRPSWRRRLAVGALFALGWVLVGIELGITRPWTRNPPCQRLGESQRAVSPDSALVVELVHEACDLGVIFVVVLSRLDAWRVTAPGTRYKLAGWESAGDDDGVMVAWTGDAAVRLALTPWSGARIQPAPLAGLTLTVVQAAPPHDGGQRSRVP